MKRNTLRIAGASALAAVVFGVAAPAASAATQRSTHAPAISAAQHSEAQQAARGLLRSNDAGARALVSGLSAAQQADLQKVAKGEFVAAGKWSAIWNVLKKIGGFGKAIAGKYKDFKRWYDGLSWWQKAAIKAVSPGLTIYDIWWHFNH
ncbi:MAG: hypothetical protein ACRDP3_03125 [Streptomyces sp.]|uniref:hypothetical protein n=1 Tax=Streptomyces sp. TaxID=1931 RepID=UPI003D6AE780